MVVKKPMPSENGLILVCIRLSCMLLRKENNWKISSSKKPLGHVCEEVNIVNQRVKIVCLPYAGKTIYLLQMHQDKCSFRTKKLIFGSGVS
jgi:hypothetical protein